MQLFSKKKKYEIKNISVSHQRSYVKIFAVSYVLPVAELVTSRRHTQAVVIKFA